MKTSTKILLAVGALALAWYVYTRKKLRIPEAVLEKTERFLDKTEDFMEILPRRMGRMAGRKRKYFLKAGKPITRDSRGRVTKGAWGMMIQKAADCYPVGSTVTSWQLKEQLRNEFGPEVADTSGESLNNTIAHWVTHNSGKIGLARIHKGLYRILPRAGRSTKES